MLGLPLFRPTRWIWATACARQWSANLTDTRSCWSRLSAEGAQSSRTVRTRRQSRSCLFREGFGLQAANRRKPRAELHHGIAWTQRKSRPDGDDELLGGNHDGRSRRRRFRSADPGFWLAHEATEDLYML